MGPMPEVPVERWWWLSSNRMTIAIRTVDDRVVSAPPIARKFVGQPSKALVRWMRKQGGFRVVELKRVA